MDTRSPPSSMKKMMPDQTLIIITVAVTASQVMAGVADGFSTLPSRTGKADTSCAIAARAKPPMRLASVIPWATAVSDKKSTRHLAPAVHIVEESHDIHQYAPPAPPDHRGARRTWMMPRRFR